jgi:recombination protein RecT
METTQIAKQQNQPATIKSFFAQDNVKKRFEEMLGNRSNQFIASVLQITANNNMLKNADPMSVYNSALIAATLDLPVNQNLGFAWIVPYKDKGVSVAQFQMGWKGYVQLAQRTGQYLSINVIDVYENQFESYNELTEELKGDFSKTGTGKVVGYAAYFKLLNGFEKRTFWTIEKVQAHGRKFSKTFSKDFSPWKSDFDAMAKKTVLKNMLSKWGILSVEMIKANTADQAVVKNADTDEVEYIDHEEITIDHEFERTRLLISDCENMDELQALASGLTDELRVIWDAKYDELSKVAKK